MPTFWYPDTCSEQDGCILRYEGNILVAIVRTCTAHSVRFKRIVHKARDKEPEPATEEDQEVFRFIKTENAFAKAREEQDVGSNRDG